MATRNGSTRDVRVAVHGGPVAVGVGVGGTGTAKHVNWNTTWILESTKTS